MDNAGKKLPVDVSGLTGSAAEIVDALARMQLAALRFGAEICLECAEPALLALLELLGFAELLPAADSR